MLVSDTTVGQVSDTTVGHHSRDTTIANRLPSTLPIGYDHGPVERFRVPSAIEQAEPREDEMAVARVTKITASSTESFQVAVEDGLARAASSLRGITGLEVLSQKAKIESGKIAEYRVTMEVTFVLDA